MAEHARRAVLAAAFAAKVVTFSVRGHRSDGTNNRRSERLGRVNAAMRVQPLLNGERPDRRLGRRKPDPVLPGQASARAPVDDGVCGTTNPVGAGRGTPTEWTADR